jgi:hypothetical protein
MNNCADAAEFLAIVAHPGINLHAPVVWTGKNPFMVRQAHHERVFKLSPEG